MDVKTVVFAIITFLHDLFTVVWMGGLIVTVIGFLPALKGSLGPGPQIKKVMGAYQKRQSLWVYICMAGLIITGLLMSQRNPQFQHLFGFGNPFAVVLSVKHILVLMMIGITLYRTLILGRAPGGLTPQKERLNFQLLLLNAALAVAVLLSSAFLAALASPLPA